MLRPSGVTRVVGVIGHPIAHSLSPTMHNASFAATGMDYVYVPLDVRPEKLAAAVAGMRALGFRGFNVTMPHKEAIIPLLDDVDKPATLAGAVNTVTIERERTLGTNTDGGGFLKACEESGVVLAGAKVLVVGAGGAAAAIGAAVLGAGAAELRVLNRNRRRADRLRSRLEDSYPGSEVRVYGFEHQESAAAEARVIVNATYLGMRDGDRLPVPAACLEDGRVVCDAVYRRGAATPIIRLARERGLQVVTGERMLLYQGVQAQRIWTGREPNVAAMEDALS